ncbi:MAG: hypothetical protein KGN16_10345 [Burkholderiales bacterium]|nr:hypothetical protein [Burkholderiales bacterium]
MFEAYHIGVRISLKNEVSSGLASIITTATQASEKFEGLNSILKSVYQTSQKLNKSFAETTAAASGAASTAAKAASAAVAQQQSIVAAQVAQMGEMRRAAASMGGVLALPMLRERGGSGGGGVIGTYYEGRRELLTNSGSGGGGDIIVRGATGLGNGDPRRRRIGGVEVLDAIPGGGGRGGGGSGGGGSAGGGFGSAMEGMYIGSQLTSAGVAGLGLIRKAVDAAGELDQQVLKFKLYGMSDAVNAEALKFAKGMRIIGTSTTDAMRLVSEAQGVFRESGLEGVEALKGAELAAPLLAKIAIATSSLDEASRSSMRHSGLQLMRFVEMRGGLQSAEKFNQIADAGWKAIQTSGGNINWEQMRQFMARGGVAAQGLSNEELFGRLEPIIGELKGSTAGFGLRTSYNRLVGAIRIPNQVAHLLTDSGIWDARKITWNSQGGIKRINGNPLKDMALFSRSPTKFYDNDIVPLYNRLKLSAAERARENQLIFGSTGGALFTLYDRQREVAERSVEAQRKALGVDASYAVASTGIQAQEGDLNAKYKNLMTEFGLKVLPMAIKGVEGLTSIIQSATDAADRFPVAAKGVILSLGALASAMVVGGSILMAASALRGLRMGLSLVSSGATAVARGLPLVASGLGAITNAATVFASAYAGWKLGEAAGSAIDRRIQKGTDYGTSSLRDWLNGTWLGQKTGLFKYGQNEALHFQQAPSLTTGHASSFIAPPAAFRSSAPEAPWSDPHKAGRVGSGALAAAGAPPQTINLTANLVVDGRKMAQVVTEHQVKGASAPQSGISGFDGSMFLAPVGLR